MKSIVKTVLGAVLVGALATGAAFAKVAPNAQGACTAKDSRNISVSMFAEDLITTTVTVYYEAEDGARWPASGVRIFDAKTNQFYGHTNDQGIAAITVRAGTTIRAVEPQYGEQQYVGEPIYNDKGEVIGWKAPSK